MIVTIVRFPSAATSQDDPGSLQSGPGSEPGLSLEEARETFANNAASYLSVPGLLWKAYLRSEDGGSVGGVYWWADRTSAETRFNPGWRAGMLTKYGAEPQIEWFDAPVVVDGRTQSILSETPPIPALPKRILAP